MSPKSFRKKINKDAREKQVLIGLVELYIETGKPIGSHTLKECGFEHLSSATIRNYFAKLEEEGYLTQQHSSGGRIPTPLAYRFYAGNCLDEQQISSKDKKFLKDNLLVETKEVVSYLQKTADVISEVTQCATFLSSARFDQDSIADIKVLPLDENRCLCAILTSFGFVHTEVLRAEKKISQFSAKRIEAFFYNKLTGLNTPELSADEEVIAKRFYSELMLRHIVGHTHFLHFDIYKTGFSKLLQYEDFNDVSTLASALSLFENKENLQKMLSDTQRLQTLMMWMGDDLTALNIPKDSSCSAITIPYTIHNTVAGAFGVLGPVRLPYKRLFAVLHLASEYISSSFTKSVYKFKISFRRPSLHPSQIKEYEANMLPLLENKPKSTGSKTSSTLQGDSYDAR